MTVVPLKPEATFKCECEDRSRTACEGEQYFGTHEAKKYCVFHFPAKEKAIPFSQALQARVDSENFNFQGFVFPQSINFEGRTFKTKVDCTDGLFLDSVSFNSAHFDQGASFAGAHFRDIALFFDVRFYVCANFESAHFERMAHFRNAMFQDNVRPVFLNAIFKGFAKFPSTIFKAGADFGWADFDAITDFSGVTFEDAGISCPVTFESATFSQPADFSKGQFRAPIEFTNTQFRLQPREVVSFEEAHFDSSAEFEGSVFSSSVKFSDAVFNGWSRFSSVVFKESVDFDQATFRSQSSFLETRFVGASNFSSVKFLPPQNQRAEADFKQAVFGGNATFQGAKFGGEENNAVEATFQSAVFEKEANFSFIHFSDQAQFSFCEFRGPVDFRDSVFQSHVILSFVTFTQYVRFRGPQNGVGFGPSARLSLVDANIEKQEKIFFHSLRLRPSWFIDVDPRKFNFTQEEWEWSSRRELDDPHPHAPLSVAYRNLAINAEENHKYEYASRFRFSAMEVLRLKEWQGFNFLTLTWWYWLLSGYGERVGRAALALGLIVILFSIPYRHTGFLNSGHPRSKITVASDPGGGLIVTPLPEPSDRTGEPLQSWRQAFIYSLEVALLQKPEPRPLTIGAQLWVTLETLLGPLVAALLALAVRRKFMR